MKVELRTIEPEGCEPTWPVEPGGRPVQLVLVFGGRAQVQRPGLVDSLRRAFRSARVVIASTAGEITAMRVTENHVSVSLISFENTRVLCAATTVRSQLDSTSAGAELARRLDGPGLVHVLVISDGQRVNGTELCAGLNANLSPGVTLTGGMAGDGTLFEKTVVGLDEVPQPGRVVAVGFYGTHLKVGFGSSGGWVPTGPEFQVTRSSGNILFELGNRSALELYKEYLGPQATRLPASALCFPLSVTLPGGGATVVRTILSVEEVTHSMVFAGDVPMGAAVRFMRATHDELVEGAGVAAHQALLGEPADFALCVSCVGRRLVLGPSTERETRRVHDVLGPDGVMAGFYSYGELSPPSREEGCELHNQTMTITTFREV